MRVCANPACGGSLEGRRIDAKFCCAPCRAEFSRLRRSETGPAALGGAEHGVGQEKRTEAHGALVSGSVDMAPGAGGIAVTVAGFTLTLDDAAIEVIARRAAEIVKARSAPEPFITAEQAAEHLGCRLPRIRALTSARRIPVHRDGTRVLFRVSELDAWVDQGGGIRP